MMTATEFRNVVNQIGSTAARARLGSANTDWQKKSTMMPAVLTMTSVE